MNPPPENHEISIYHASLDDVWCRNEMIVDDALAYTITTEIMLSDDIEPRFVDECRRKSDWSNGNKQSKSNLIHLRNARCLNM